MDIQSIVEVRARQRRKVPVPDAVPLKNIRYMPVPTLGLPQLFPRLFFPDFFYFSSHTFLMNYFPHSPNGKGKGIVDSGYIFSSSAQSRTKTCENVFPDHIRPHLNPAGFDRFRQSS